MAEFCARKRLSLFHQDQEDDLISRIFHCRDGIVIVEWEDMSLEMSVRPNISETITET